MIDALEIIKNPWNMYMVNLKKFQDLEYTTAHGFVAYLELRCHWVLYGSLSTLLD